MREQKTSKLSVHAEKVVDEMLVSIKNGWQSGKIDRSQLASWIILHFQGKLFQQLVDKIRSDHFDQKAALEAALEAVKAAEHKGIQVDLTELLSPVLSRNQSKLAKPVKAPAEMATLELADSRKKNLAAK